MRAGDAEDKSLSGENFHQHCILSSYPQYRRALAAESLTHRQESKHRG